MNEIASSAYPDDASARDRWIVARRGARELVSAEEPYAFLVEQERFATGESGPVATIFLTNRECPWRCAMCDLWQHTLPDAVPPGAIPRQIEYALSRLPPARQVKLYNSGSFFDPRAVPPEDYDHIAALVCGFERVIVECHPSIVGERCARFQQLLGTKLEVAIGLETAHPVALEKLNKRMTVAQFSSAAEWLRSNDIDLRTFLLVHPPFIPPDEAAAWERLSIDCALRCGATAITLIPTRAGNGALDELALQGAYTPPTLHALEEAQRYGLRTVGALSLGPGQAAPRIFVDLWDIERFAQCEHCREERLACLHTMNGLQKPGDAVLCAACGELS